MKIKPSNITLHLAVLIATNNESAILSTLSVYTTYIFSRESKWIRAVRDEADD